jgi:hypothetical protein
MEELHHSDIVTLALTRLALDFGREPDEIAKALRKGEGRTSGSLAAATQPPTLELPKAELPKTPERPAKSKSSKDKFQGF